MIRRAVIAIAIGVVVFLLVVLLGVVLVALDVPVLTSVGAFCKQWAAVIGVLAAVLAFFTGWSPL